MQTVLVMKQLTSVLDAFMWEVTRRVRLSPQDVMVMAWMVDQPGISGGEIATRLGRKRQNVHRALQRLEDRFISEKFRSVVDNRTVGWGLTEHGVMTWAEIERGFRAQDEMLQKNGVVTRPFIDGLRRMMDELMGTAREMTALGLFVPPPLQEPPEWDL